MTLTTPPTEDFEANYKAFIQAEVDRHKADGDDGLKRWMTALNVGSGAGLLGIFGLAAKPEGTTMLYLLLPSAWLFVLGLLMASTASLLLIGGNRQSERYWRSVENKRVERVSGKGVQPATVKEMEDADKRGDRYDLAGGLLAIGSGILFIAGVVIPLVRLTARAIGGDL